MRVWWKIVGLIYGVLALAGAGFLAVLDSKGALILIGTMALALGVGVLGPLASITRARHALPTVRVVDGLVEVFRPLYNQGKSPVATFRLEEAHWRPGKLQQDSYFRGRGGALVVDQRVVILQSPRRWAQVAPPSEFTAVGSSPEMVRIWKGFLQIAGVPEGK
jgi:hypothetical protein